MSIQFICLKQSTVFSYPFDLISLSSENALQARIVSLASEEEHEEEEVRG